MKKAISKESLEHLRELLIDKEEKVSAVIVVQSKNTGKDITYKVSSSIKRGTHIMYVAVEQGYQTYHKIAYVINDNITAYRKMMTPTQKGGWWLLNNLHEGNINLLLEKANLYHTGKCIKCNRPLTDLESIEYAMGPICRGAGNKRKGEEPQPYNREG